MRLARPMARFALHTRQMGRDELIQKTTRFIKTHTMAGYTVRIIGLIDRQQMFIRACVLALPPYFMLLGMTGLARCLTREIAGT